VTFSDVVLQVSVQAAALEANLVAGGARECGARAGTLLARAGGA
jgi:hypothetical protein